MIIKNRQTILQINIEIYLFIANNHLIVEFARYIYIIYVCILSLYISMVQAFHLLTYLLPVKIMIHPNNKFRLNNYLI